MPSLPRLRADPAFAPAADQLENAFRALDVEGDTNPDAAGLVAVIEYVCRAKKGSLLNRLRLLAELAEFKGKIKVPRALLANRNHPKNSLSSDAAAHN